jgi:RNA polymerase sigma-70 factor (ECF subfamily)
VVIVVILTESEFSRLKKRDKEILEKVYNYYKGSIHAYFLVKTFGNASISDDLTHETFCAVIQAVPKLVHAEKLYFWIFTIAKNTLLRYQRKLYSHKKYVNVMKEQVEDTQDITEKLHDKQKILLLRMAIDSLNPLYRKIYHCYYSEQKKIKEIASEVGRSGKAVENILARIRANLKKEMMKLAKNFFNEE